MRQGCGVDLPQQPEHMGVQGPQLGLHLRQPTANYYTYNLVQV